MKKIKTINIAKDFNAFPLGRYYTHSEYCGENFMENLLTTALNENEEVIIDLNGTMGIGYSFLEEVFGGIIRKYPHRQEEFINKIKIISTENSSLANTIDDLLRNNF